MTTLLIDNYDSFTYNLYQYLSELGADVVVHRNDQIDVETCLALEPDHVVISPGPGTPDDSGVSRDVIRAFAGKVPVLGVCLGHQCIFEVYGGQVANAGEIRHGKTSPVEHDGRGVFAGIPDPFTAVRYHSLAGTPTSTPDVLDVTARSDSGVIMGIRHRELTVEGVQFHPESIATEHGKVLLRNFLEMEGEQVVVQDCIRALIAGEGISGEQAAGAMEELMTGAATPAQIGAYLAALRMHGETAEVIAASARVMQAHAEPVHVSGVIDIVGTGGDGADTFNVSTAAAIVCAAAGAKVAKHGNRAMSSRCGSADVLEALGARVDLGPEAAARVLEETGFVFLFAQKYHTAMKNVAGPRRELGVRTIFNLLGPLTNPASPKRQLTGVGDVKLAALMAQALALKGMECAMVVSSGDGLDEITTAGATSAWFIEDGAIREESISPATFGLPEHPLESILGGDAQANAARMHAVVDGIDGPVTDFVLMNAAAGCYVAGLAGSLEEGVAVARNAITSGRARGVLARYIQISNEAAGD